MPFGKGILDLKVQKNFLTLILQMIWCYFSDFEFENKIEIPIIKHSKSNDFVILLVIIKIVLNYLNFLLYLCKIG